MGRYDDIIDHPHHVSQVHPRMSLRNRAAQFSPFAALTGYDDQIAEAARLTDRRVELTEAEAEEIGRQLGRLGRGDGVELTYFLPDDRKAGGRYVTERVTVRQVLPAEGRLRLMDGRQIDIDAIIGVDESPD
jgi:hypothetical protein